VSSHYETDFSSSTIKEDPYSITLLLMKHMCYSELLRWYEPNCMMTHFSRSIPFQNVHNLASQNARTKMEPPSVYSLGDADIKLRNERQFSECLYVFKCWALFRTLHGGRLDGSYTIGNVSIRSLELGHAPPTTLSTSYTCTAVLSRI